MPYLFTPPYITVSHRFPGTRNLRYSFEISQTVWKDADGWHVASTPSQETLEAAIRALAPTPQIVDDTAAVELIDAGIGTCNPIQP